MKIKDFTVSDAFIRKGQTTLIIILFVYIIHLQYNLFSLFPIKLNISKEGTKITDWLQALGGLASLIVAIVVGFIGYRFNQYMRIQNKLMGEESRPILKYNDIKPNEKNYALENYGEFEADNIRLYKFSYKKGDKNISYNYGKGIIDSLPKGGIERIGFNDMTFESNIILYTNRVSDVVHIIGFNFYTEDEESLVSIGTDIDGNKNPLNLVTYKKVLDLIKIKNQALNFESSDDVYRAVEEILSRYFKKN